MPSEAEWEAFKADYEAFKKATTGADKQLTDYANNIAAQLNDHIAHHPGGTGLQSGDTVKLVKP